MLTDLLEFPPPEEGHTLIDDLLGEQQLLTPVAGFSLRQERGGLPAQAKYYRDLIPLSLPAAGPAVRICCRSCQLGLLLHSLTLDR
jgi:hypothetical protein